MGKSLLLVLVMFLCTWLAGAQNSISFTRANTQIIPGIVHYNSADITNFNAPKADTNHAWNYASLKFVASADINFLSNPFITFNASPIAIATVGALEQLTSNCQIPANIVYDEDSLGVYEAGQFIPGQNFSLYNYFSNPKDSLFVPKQADYCRVNILNFPTKAKSVYKKKSVRSLNFNITVASESYKKTTGVKNTYFTVKDTVMGWGTLRVPSPDKSSIPYNVLLLKKKTETIDSVFINKKVPPDIYLNALGITQGKKTTTYEQFFYRAGYANPIMSMNYGADSTCTIPISILYATDSIKSSIQDFESSIDNLTIFPNPASDYVNCRFTKTSLQPWKLVLTNSLGQELITRQILGYGDMTLSIEPGNPLKGGLFFLDIFDENGLKTGSAKINILK